ncbi:MAG: hypothetical protein ACI85I_000361 [Arenicella sp.]|jgi:hypothetical protein
MKYSYRKITEEEAFEKFAIDDYELVGEIPFTDVIVFDGDITWEGDLAIGDEECPTFLILADLHCEALHR